MTKRRSGFDRRDFLQHASAIAVVTVGGAALSACGGGGGGSAGGTAMAAAAPTPAPTPTPPVSPPALTPTSNGTSALVASRNNTRTVASDAWKNQLKVQITPVGGARPVLFDMSTQGQRMDDFVRPGGVGNSAYYRVDLSVAVPGLWLALHYSPATPFDGKPHASYVFENQPTNRFRTEADADRLNYTAQIIDTALGVNVTTPIGSAATDAEARKLKHGQDQRWILQSRPWPSDTVANVIPGQVAAGLIFDSEMLTSGGKSTIPSDPTPPIAYTPLTGANWARYFPSTGGRNEIGPNGPAWTNKAIRLRNDAERLSAWEAIKTQFSFPCHAREKDGSMSLWKEGVGIDGLNNAEKQFGLGNGQYGAGYYTDLDNGGWQIDGAHRGNGMFAMAALQGGVKFADPLVIEEAVYTGCVALNAGGAFDRREWNVYPGSVLPMGQGRELAWAIRDMTSARSLIPTENVPNWLVTRGDFDVCLDATLDVLESNENGSRLTFGLLTVFSSFFNQNFTDSHVSPTYEFLLYAMATAYRNTGNVRYKNLLKIFAVNRLANRTLASPKYAAGHEYGHTKQLADGSYVAYADWSELFRGIGSTSTAADTWVSFISPEDGSGGYGDYNITLFEGALIAKNLVGISDPTLDALIALYRDKWLNNSKASDASTYQLTAQWAIKTTA